MDNASQTPQEPINSSPPQPSDPVSVSQQADIGATMPLTKPKKRLKIVALAVLILLAAGAATWFILVKKDTQISTKNTNTSQDVNSSQAPLVITKNDYFNIPAESQTKLDKLLSQIDDVSSLVKTLNDDEATAVFSHAIEFGQFADQNNGTVVDVSKKPSSPSDKKLKFYIIEAGDEKLGEPFRSYINISSIAAYDPHNNAIAFKTSDDISSGWGAFLLLHEMYHAKDYYDHSFSYNYADAMVRAGREVDVDNFLLRLYPLAGGDTYRLYESKVRAYLEPAVKQKGVNVIPEIAAIYKQPFGDDGFGASNSQRETFDRTNSIGTAIALELLAKDFPDKARNLQETLMYNEYNNY